MARTVIKATTDYQHADADFAAEGRLIRFPAGIEDTYFYGLLSE